MWARGKIERVGLRDVAGTGTRSFGERDDCPRMITISLYRLNYVEPRGIELQEQAAQRVVELRKKFAAQKLEKAKGQNQVLVRCEPHPKHCHIERAPCLTLMAPTGYAVAYILATIQTRVLTERNFPETSAYLFC